MGPTQTPENKEDPRSPGDGLLSPKALLLLIVAVGVGDLYAYNPRAGAAVVAAITVLAVLIDVIA